MYISNFTSPPLINPNALLYEENHNHLLQSQPEVIQPMNNIDLSPIHNQIFPNESSLTYDKHHFHESCGLEMDIMILFYKEDKLFEKHKGKISINNER